MRILLRYWVYRRTPRGRDVRRKMDEVEMEGRLGRTNVDQGALVRATQKLSNSRQRLECEVFISWKDSDAYGYCADEHDYALEMTRTFFADHRGSVPGVAARLVRAWAGVVADPDVSAAMNQRLAALGLAGNDRYLATITGDLVIPAAVQRTLEFGTTAEPRSRRCPSGVRLETVSAAEAMADHVERSVAEEGSVNSLSVQEVSGLLDSVVASAEQLNYVSPSAARRMIDAIATAANATAWERANQGDLDDAAAILDDLASSDLPAALQVEVDRDRQILHDAIQRKSERPASQGPAIKGTEGLPPFGKLKAKSRMAGVSSYSSMSSHLSLSVPNRRQGCISFVPVTVRSVEPGRFYWLPCFVVGGAFMDSSGQSVRSLPTLEGGMTSLSEIMAAEWHAPRSAQSQPDDYVGQTAEKRGSGKH